jgi:DNA-binding response OmpR family regulator
MSGLPSGRNSAHVVLVVEDDGATATPLRILLRHLGYDVRFAKNLKQAKALLNKDVECVVLDLMLPDGDGAEIISFARERHLPARIVVVTGVSESDYLRKVGGLRPDRLLPKPMEFTELLDALEAR